MVDEKKNSFASLYRFAERPFVILSPDFPLAPFVRDFADNDNREKKLHARK